MSGWQKLVRGGELFRAGLKVCTTWWGKVVGRKGVSNNAPGEGRPSDADLLQNPFSSTALTLRSRPPRYVMRIVSLTLVGGLAITLVFSYFAHIDIVVSLQGTVIPAGKSKTVQPLESGVVRQIFVRDGQMVAEGDVLIELDTTTTVADLSRLQREKMELTTEIARLQAMAEKRGRLKLPDSIPVDIALNQRSIFLSRTEEYRQRIASLEAAVAKQSADLQALQAGITQLRLSGDVVKRKHQMRLELAQSGHLANAVVMETELELINIEKEIAVQTNRLAESRSALKAAEHQLSGAHSEYEARVGVELAEAIKKNNGIDQELVKAQKRSDLQLLRAPISGVVQQLAIFTTGGVVTPAQPLLVVVPENTPLEVEARVMNRDAGHIKVGQRVLNKIETFDYVRYGYIEGQVEWMGTDAVSDPKADPRQGTLYPLRIHLSSNQTPQKVNGRVGLVTAGMTVSCDILVGRRRLLEYFIAPLVRFQTESLRER